MAVSFSSGGLLRNFHHLRGHYPGYRCGGLWRVRSSHDRARLPDALSVERISASSWVACATVGRERTCASATTAAGAARTETASTTVELLLVAEASGTELVRAALRILTARLDA